MTWIRNGDETLDDLSEEIGEAAVTNLLEIADVGRAWRNSTLTCLAVNSDLIEPVTKTFMLEIHRKYLSMIISSWKVIREILDTRGNELMNLLCCRRGLLTLYSPGVSIIPV